MIKRTIEYEELVSITHKVEVELPYEDLDLLEDIANETDFSCNTMDEVLDIISQKVNILNHTVDIDNNKTESIEWIDDYDSDTIMG